MKKTKKNPPIKDVEFIESVSVNECTGLIPSAPEDSEELESYFDVVKFSPEDINNDKEYDAEE